MGDEWADGADVDAGVCVGAGLDKGVDGVGVAAEGDIGEAAPQGET